MDYAAAVAAASTQPPPPPEILAYHHYAAASATQPPPPEILAYHHYAAASAPYLPNTNPTPTAAGICGPFPAPPPAAMGPTAGLPPYCLVSYPPVRQAVRPKASLVDLETQKQKLIQGGAAPDSLRSCPICNVVCNSEKVFSSHLASKKHISKALGRSSVAMAQVASSQSTCSTDKVTRVIHIHGKKKVKNGLPSVVQSVSCDVCKITCNSQEILNNHNLGKKHIKNLQKLQESMIPKTSNDVATSSVNTALVSNNSNIAMMKTKRKGKHATKEDLEAKRQKVLKGGAAADAVQVCAICNVVCNSQTVFNFHIAGQKHIAMLKKQQEASVC